MILSVVSVGRITFQTAISVVVAKSKKLIRTPLNLRRI